MGMKGMKDRDTDGNAALRAGRDAGVNVALKDVPTQLTALQVMGDAPVIPVIVLEDAALAVPLARALVAGGIRMLEVTLRTPAALDAIRVIAQEVPEAVAGAGTVRSSEDARAAAQAGARFAVSPGFTRAVGRACRDLGLPLLPGVATSSEIMLAQEEGYEALKFFPALQAGGTAMLKAWSGPFAEMKFCPTGGVTLANAREFLALPQVACVGGSWLTPADALAEAARTGDWRRITALAKEAVALRAPA